jgi:hypothetical protein
MDQQEHHGRIKKVQGAVEYTKGAKWVGRGEYINIVISIEGVDVAFYVEFQFQACGDRSVPLQAAILAASH